ncbi:hypothetical protein BDW42DRAFT_32272 [Aspergillus taichungensis]|uniref:RWD domain-containing protein n=1 Tax=Aspergillus taichungensis TaxID=482145 RepID=A0A2J5HFY2_9EURO|nr:hypothetical protein BDW42DRAFT_32272 [Aspergillus taichungensis]
MADPTEPRPLTSAYESPTFGEDSSFHVEQPVGSMSVSPCGRDVVLASKEGLHIIDLDSPYSPPRYLPHHTPWEVADVQWSPFPARDSWVVSTSNQKALVWNLGMKSWQNSIEHVLHAHTRAITDVNFSAHHPDALATCAVDSFVHCWDLRLASRPVISFSDWFAGATQVKWSRQDPNIIASSHDRFLRIWDKRKGTYPIRSIEAHNTKIYGVDWNRVRPGALVTCSLDRTVKFWDYTVEGDVPEKVIKMPFPVRRARNTPFGWGVLAMPQRGDGDLHLYSRRVEEGIDADEDVSPVHSFPGHKGQVKEFVWRARGGETDRLDDRDFQLVSWGTDRELRLHKVGPEVLQKVGYEKGKSYAPNMKITRKGAVYRSFRDTNPHQEFDDSESIPSAFQAGASQPSIGMGPNTISVPYPRGWTQRGNADSRVGMQGRSNFRADTNPISWMRGVKISGWDIETLGDEITHVGEKFTKVAFESVDVRQRKATISLHGPWGADGASLFLKVDIKFPVDYPKASTPAFRVQKTTGVTDQLTDKIIAELRTISETYLSHNRGCLEGVVRYLLGESSLEESIAWILGETAETVKSPVNGQIDGDESSDEDEVGLSHSQELGMSSELLRPVNANVNVPVAKVCGALWSNDGRLVCFFPSKKDKSASLLENLGFREMTRLSRADKVFEGFGRLQTNSPGPRPTGTITSTDDGTSDYSDDSDAESSSSSGSSGILSGLQHRFPTPQTWRSAGSMGLYRPRSTDNSQRSTAGAMTSKSSDPPQNLISIHDLSDLLPSKRDLARKYRICGKGTDVCAHNCSVALDHGYHELARIWGLLRSILHDSKEAILPPDPENVETKYLIRRKDSAVDLSYDMNTNQPPKEPSNGVISWGDHPFGSRWLIPALFEHFERNGDVQMVAMLSCILYERSCEVTRPPERVRHRKSASRRFSPQNFPTFIQSHADSQNKPQTITPPGVTPKDSHATPVTQSSARSSSENWRADATPPYSTGTTPPVPTRFPNIGAEKRATSQTVSISASPDQQSQTRSGSGFGSVLASSLSRSFTFGPSSASPPGHALSRKKQSPGGSPNTTAGIWGTNSSGAKAVPAVPEYLATSTALTSRTHSDTGSDRAQVSKPAGRLQARPKNQGAFDCDGEVSRNSFIDGSKEQLYRAYRVAYAHMLSIWGLPIQRSEVLKIGRTSNPSTAPWRRRGHKDSFSFSNLGNRPSTAPDTSRAEGLEIQRHCSGCGKALQVSIFSTQAIAEETIRHRIKSNTLPPTCLNCKPKHALAFKLPCIICGEVVEGMLMPCLGCGHVCCFNCHAGWFSTATTTTIAASKKNDTPAQDTEYCPSGCGCRCSEYAVTDIAAPWSPSSPTLSSDNSHGSNPLNRTTTHRHNNRRSDGSSRNASDALANVGQHEDDLDHWQASPFASLARGLGGGLSRGLRAKDERRKSKPTNAAAFVPRKTALNQVEY